MQARVLAIIIGLVAVPLMVGAEEPEAVGIVTATQGTVTMQPATLTAPKPLHADDPVGPLAILESQPDARCKILYTDDSLLTLGGASRLEVTEQTYRAGSSTRAFVAHLSRGAVRALVGRRFEDDNSVFDIHSGTTVARARGTYFVVWNEGAPTTRRSLNEEEGRSGVANIGQSGHVAFTSGGATVLVMPGQFSVAIPGEPPTMPTPIDLNVKPLASAMSGTVLADSVRPESPRAALAAVGLGQAAAASPASPTSPRIEAGVLGGQAPSGSYMLPVWPQPITPVTPPAVVSGAVRPTTTVNLSIVLP